MGTGICVPMALAFGSIYFYGAYYGTNRYENPTLMLVVIVFYLTFFIIWPVVLWSMYGAVKSSVLRTLKLQLMSVICAAFQTMGIRALFANVGSTKRAVGSVLGSGPVTDIICDWFLLSFLTGVLLPAFYKCHNMIFLGNIGASGRITISLGLRSVKSFASMTTACIVGTHLSKFLVVRFHMTQFNPFVTVIFTAKDLAYAFIHFGARAHLGFILSVLVHERCVYDPATNKPTRLKESGAICDSTSEEFVVLPPEFKKWRLIFKWAVDWVPRWTRILFPHVVRYPLCELTEGAQPSDRIDDDMGTSLALGFGPCYTVIASLPPHLVDCDSKGDLFFKEFESKTQEHEDHQMWNRALQLWAASGFGFAKDSEQNLEDVANAQLIPLCNSEVKETLLKTSFGNFSQRQAMVCSPVAISISFLNYYNFTSRASSKITSAYLIFFCQTVIQYFFVYDKDTGAIVSDHPATCDFRKWQHTNGLLVAIGVLLVDLVESYTLLSQKQKVLKDYFGVSIQETVDRWCITLWQHRGFPETPVLETWWLISMHQNYMTNMFWTLCKTVYE